MHTQFLQRWRNLLAWDSHRLSRREKFVPVLNVLHKGWDIWLWLTGPDAQNFDKSIEDQERLRRSRLLSSLIPLIVVAIFVFLPSALATPTDWIPICLIAVFDVAIALLNRRGKVTAAGLLYTVAIDLGVIVLAVTHPQGISNSNIPDFDIFALSILISGLILDRVFIPFIALFQLATGIILFNIVPHDSLLTQEIQVHLNGDAYSYLADFFLLEICGATLAWLSSKSFTLALKRADRADELDQLVQQQRVLLEEVNRLYQEKALAAETDAVTNLLNHRAIMDHISEEVALCQEHESTCALLFVDLDHFKHINDTWGHRAGDTVLRETGKRLQAVIPEQSFVGRYGGEEFAIVLHDVDLLSATQTAERIKAAVTTLPYIWQAEDAQEEIPLMVTASLGIALYGPHCPTAELLLEFADRAMYSAKEQGRNRICIAEVEVMETKDALYTIKM